MYFPLFLPLWAETRETFCLGFPNHLIKQSYPDVQAFMKTYRKAEAIVTQYNQDLEEWGQAVRNG